MLKMKIKHLPLWDTNAGYSLHNKTPFPVAKATLKPRVRASLFFETLKKCLPDSFDVLCSDKTEIYAENSASPEQILRIIERLASGL